MKEMGLEKPSQKKNLLKYLEWTSWLYSSKSIEDLISWVHEYSRVHKMFNWVKEVQLNGYIDPNTEHNHITYELTNIKHELRGTAQPQKIFLNYVMLRTVTKNSTIIITKYTRYHRYRVIIQITGGPPLQLHRKPDLKEGGKEKIK